MTNSTNRLRGVVLAVLLTTGTAARADLVHWSYSWSRSPSQVQADAPGTSYISLSDEAVRQVVGDSDIVSTNLRTVSSAPDGTPDHFTNKPYVLTLTLTDQASNVSGNISFSGVFNGTVAAHSANISSTFTGPTSQTIVLGNYKYTVTLPYYTPPGPPDATNAGSISAHVTVTMELVKNLPEPSSLLLAGLGVLLVSLVHTRGNWRRFPLLPA
jgi:hypothetical protein